VRKGQAPVSEPLLEQQWVARSSLAARTERKPGISPSRSSYLYQVQLSVRMSESAVTCYILTHFM
jgi:hypothetical protein